MTILPKEIYRLGAILIKITMAFFTQLEEWILKFVCNHKRPRIVKEILRKKNKTRGIMLLGSKLYYTISIQNNMALAQKQTQINGTE